MEIIGPLQLRVMHHIWENGACTVHQVHDALNNAPGATKLAYTTILTVMRNLGKRKILDQRPAGRSHIFEPLVSEEEYKIQLISHITGEFFNGDYDRLSEVIQDCKNYVPAEEVEESNEISSSLFD